jgi:glycosyltransferase 2 family protein
MTQPSSKWRKWRGVFRLTVTLGVIGLLLWKLGGGRELVAVLAGITPAYFVFILAAITLDRVLMTFKWLRLLRSQGIHLPFLRGMKIYCASMVWGLFMPMTIGADAVRTYMSTRAGINTSQVIASIIVERIIGFSASLLMAFCGFLLLSRAGFLDAHFYMIGCIGGIALLSACVLFPLSFSPRVIEWLHNGPFFRYRNLRLFKLLRELQTNYGAYRHKKATLAGFFALSILEQLATILYVWLIARGLGVDVGLAYVGGALPLAILIARIPISVSGLGVFDGAFALLISLTGVSLAEAVAITVAMRILEIVTWLPWWLASVIQTGSLHRPVVSNAQIPRQPAF